MSTTDAHIRIYIWLIDSDGTVKPERLSVREAMERPNGRRIVLIFNNEMQSIGDEAGLLSGVLGLLGSNYEKFSIGKESWHKVTTKDKVYNECVKNIEHRPPKIDREHWRKLLEYRAKPETKEKCKKNATNRSKQVYTHTGGSKNFTRLKNKEGDSVEESYGSKCTKKNDGSYMNDEARAIGERIEEIEQQDESSGVLSQNDSIAQVFGKEKPGRVRGVGFGPTPTQLFGLNSHAPGNRVKVEETQRKLFALQAELEGEKLKRKAIGDLEPQEKLHKVTGKLSKIAAVCNRRKMLRKK
ncbi:uncharacterized protein [Arachis hypogaea]|uniref:uncharacterized protein n=1 Tax=Arachis hypogaea TaxID=3818 RepID=UPI000DECB78C|nr:uncharacterized protein LOC112749131 [Arachis hypogaea]